MRRLLHCTVGAVIAASLAAVSPVRAAMTRTWVGVVNDDWFVPGNWEPSDNYPQADDTVIIPSGKSVSLTNATASLAAFEIENATLTFSNWTTRLRATSVTIENGGILTHANNPESMIEEMWTPTARVWIECDDLFLHQDASIEADARGYRREAGPGRALRAPHATGYVHGNGAGYGGHGGRGSEYDSHSDAEPPGGIYGSLVEPTDPGSGGGRASQGTGTAGAGGGAIRIDAAETVTIDGTVSVNGQSAGGNASPGGGSGGSIYISCHRFGGNTTGSLRANGGNGRTSGGGGGGGRIAVHYSELSGSPGIRFMADRGSSRWTEDESMPSYNLTAAVGSVYLPDTSLMNALIESWDGVAEGLSGMLYFGATNVWNSSVLNEIKQGGLGLGSGTVWNVSGDLEMNGGRTIVGKHAVLNCADNLILADDAVLVIYGGETNGVVDYGSILDVGKLLKISDGTVIYPFSHSTNGGSPLIRAGNIHVESGGQINATARGFFWGLGPGYGEDGRHVNGGIWGHGAGHGGKGGRGATTDRNPGGVYGSTNAPIYAGSGGGRSSSSVVQRGGHGGGVIRLEVENVAWIDGELLANGGNGRYSDCGGGSGGSIYIICDSFGGQGQIRADGGNKNDNGGGGGGGRIAVWTKVSEISRQMYLNGHGGGVVRLTQSPHFNNDNISVNPGDSRFPYPDAENRDPKPGTHYFYMVRGSMFMFR